MHGGDRLKKREIHGGEGRDKGGVDRGEGCNGYKLSTTETESSLKKMKREYQKLPYMTLKNHEPNNTTLKHCPNTMK